MNDHFKNDKKAMWLGVNGCEYITWEDSYEVIEYDPYHSQLPAHVIVSDKRIQNEDDMLYVLNNGQWHSAAFEKAENWKGEFKC